MHPLRILHIHALLAVAYIKITNGQIPASMLAKVANMNSTKDFMLKMVVNRNRSRNVTRGSLEDVMFTAKGSVDPDRVEEAAHRVAPPDGCHPTYQPVALPKHSDPNVIYYPSCVQLLRCGGCCPGEIYECAATRVSTQTISAMRLRYPHIGATRFEYEATESHLLDVHQACKCRCRVQPYHCNTAIQVYADQECRCKCKNEAQATSCAANKKWDERKCQCTCARIQECDSGQVFDKTNCRCVGSSVSVPGSYDPCRNRRCRPGYQPRKVSTFICRCELASSLPLQRSLRAATHSRPRHIEERFPMMRAGVFDRR